MVRALDTKSTAAGVNPSSTGKQILITCVPVPGLTDLINDNETLSVFQLLAGTLADLNTGKMQQSLRVSGNSYVNFQTHSS